MPVAVTLNDADCPVVTVLLAGCVVIDGPTEAAVTVRIAGLLVRLPVLSVTTTVNCAPLSALVVAGVVYDAPDAAPIGDPFFFHWYVSVPDPVATTENVAVLPVTTDWFSGCAVMASAAIPVPLREMASEEFVASLAMETLPEALPAPAGVNWI